MRFADARGTQKYQITPFVEETSRCQLLHQTPVQVGLGCEIELLQALVYRKAGELEVEFYAATLPLAQLPLQQIAQEVAVTPLPRRRLLASAVEALVGDAEAEGL